MSIESLCILSINILTTIRNYIWQQKKNGRYKIDRLKWLRRKDLNLRPSGYEPDELPDCSTPRYTHQRCWCRKPGSNRYEMLVSRDFKSRASANFATPAFRFTEPAAAISDCLYSIPHLEAFVNRFLQKKFEIADTIILQMQTY